MRATIAVFSMLLPVLSAAQAPNAPSDRTSPREDDFQLRISGPVHVATGDTAGTIWVVNDSATIDGVVREALGVINGHARISGRVQGTVVVVNGRLELAPGARVDRDVVLYRSTLTRAPDVVVGGAIHEQTGFSFGAHGIWLIWLSFTIVVVVAGVLFAALAPRVLADSATYMAAHTGRSALAALILVAAVPAIAMISFATVIGIPLGLTLLFVVVPALSFLGYMIAGAALGAALLGRRWVDGSWPQRYRTMVVGLLGLQIIGIVPVIGGLAVLIASQLGVGALVARRWSERRRPVPAGIPAVAAT